MSDHNRQRFQRQEYIARINRVMDYIEGKHVVDICVPVRPL